jgi:hypothetical protein
VCGRHRRRRIDIAPEIFTNFLVPGVDTTPAVTTSEREHLNNDATTADLSGSADVDCSCGAAPGS